MARIKGVSPAQAGLQMKITYHFTRRSIAKLTGRESERMIEPLEIYALVPVLFKGCAKLEQATARLHRLDKRLHALAELKAATLTHCGYCIDMGSAIARQWGLTDEELLALPRATRCQRRGIADGGPAWTWPVSGRTLYSARAWPRVRWPRVRTSGPPAHAGEGGQAPATLVAAALGAAASWSGTGCARRRGWER